MVEETFTAPTPREAFELAREKYGVFSDLKLLRATQQRDEEGRLRAHIVVSVPQEEYLESIGIDEEEELIGEIHQLRDQMERMKTAMNPQTPLPNAIEEVKTMMRDKGLPPAWLTMIGVPAIRCLALSTLVHHTAFFRELLLGLNFPWVIKHAWRLNRWMDAHTHRTLDDIHCNTFPPPSI